MAKQTTPKAQAPKAQAPKAQAPKAQAPKAQAPKAQAPAAPPVVAPVVALRGGLAVQAVALTGKPYRSAAAHNTAWWAAVTAACASGPATVQALVQAQVPTHFVGYTVRRGYLKAV